MDHLKIDEILAFVSLEELNEETIKFASYVNGHILSCKECREKVVAFQTVYDNLSGKGLVNEIDESFLENDKKVADVEMEMQL